MGLLYPFPVSLEETDFVVCQRDTRSRLRALTLKTYGLPYVFWLYALACLVVLVFLWLAVRAPLEKLLTLESSGLDYLLVYGLQGLLAAAPLLLAGFFFFEKRLCREGNELRIESRIFGICVQRRRLVLHGPENLVLRHHLDSPNVARLRGESEDRSFQNKGYFELWYATAEREFMIDRHSRKADLIALRDLLLLELEASNGSQR